MNQFMQPFGAAIRKQRKSLGLTQSELAELAGCGEAFLHLLEHGKATVRIDKVLDVLNVLGLQLRLELGKNHLEVSAELL